MRRTYFEHSFANYPTSFRGCKVSPTKICMQFNNAEIKLRQNANSKSEYELPKNEMNERYVATSTGGIDIGCTAIGCQMPTLEECQFELMRAYKEYYLNYRQVYKETYNKNFSDFIRLLKRDIDYLLSYIEKAEQDGR